MKIEFRESDSRLNDYRRIGMWGPDSLALIMQ